MTTEPAPQPAPMPGESERVPTENENAVVADAADVAPTTEDTTIEDAATEASTPVEPDPPIVEIPAPDAVEAPEVKKPSLQSKPVGKSTGGSILSAGAATLSAVPTASSPADDDAAFDPAVDLPAYRAGMDWFVLRVASNKENYVRETLLRKVQIEGLENRVGRIMVPTEKTKTLKGGKTKITETKLYPGYVFVEMKLETDGRIPQDVFFLIKETTGVGDFVGTAGRPTPMSPPEVEKMLFDSKLPEEMPEVKMEFERGDNVMINEGPFENYEGTVDEMLPDKGLVRVLVTIFGRQAPVELEYWQISKVEG